jgi:hypothetical protein
VRTFNPRVAALRYRPITFNATVVLPSISAKADEHQLDHVALPMVRRRRMRKDEQLHAEKRHSMNMSAAPVRLRIGH